jgi:hypothetical protein
MPVPPEIEKSTEISWPSGSEKDTVIGKLFDPYFNEVLRLSVRETTVLLLLKKMMGSLLTPARKSKRLSQEVTLIKKLEIINDKLTKYPIELFFIVKKMLENVFIL